MDIARESYLLDVIGQYPPFLKEGIGGKQPI